MTCFSVQMFRKNLKPDVQTADIVEHPAPCTLLHHSLAVLERHAANDSRRNRWLSGIQQSLPVHTAAPGHSRFSLNLLPEWALAAASATLDPRNFFPRHAARREMPKHR